ncbi:MAG: Flp family type IVb pilin [Chloroflexota bacterium]|nr:Flp family type IVb pilin [Chloroflexota bacterium]
MLTKISNFVLRLVARFQSEKGQALTEYGLILALIAVVCIVALGAIGVAIAGFLDDIAAALG